MSPFIIGIAGGSGAGKSTLARALEAELAPAAIVELDWYYHDLGHLTPDERAEANFDHPDALEWALLREQLAALKRAEAVQRPVYDFATHTRVPAPVTLGAAPVVVVEGILALHDPGVRALFDYKVFVDAPRAVRLDRRTRRDVAERGRSISSVAVQFNQTVGPMHERFVAPSRRYADLCVDGAAPPGLALPAIVAAR